MKEERSSEQLVGGAFAYETAPFAIHSLDQQRAREWRSALKKEGKTWADAEVQIRTYLRGKNCTDDYINDQIVIAKKFLKSI